MQSRRRGVLLPVFCWLVVSGVIFVGQFHRTQASRAAIHFRVSMEGREGNIFHEATLNGTPYQASKPCGVGWKKLVIRAEDAEPFETNAFTWYGGQEFGKITLARTRGRMDLDFSPAVETVRIIGAEERKALTNVTRESLSLPTGRYRVEAGFARFNVERTVEVMRNQTTHVSITPSITTLNLSSEPENAEFELKSKGAPQVSASGRTPMSITDVPAGEYELAIARGDYRKNLPVTLFGTKTTNEVKVEFRYARMSITSEPEDAAISVGGKVIGRTPAGFDLQPGSFRLSITKDGYFGTNLDLTLLETDSRTVSVPLVNVSFVEALERARKHSFGGMDYDRALADLEQALRIKPGDESALQLKRTIQFNWHLRNARQFQRKREFSQALFEVDAALKLSANDADALVLKTEAEKGQRDVDEQRAKAKEAAAAAQAEARRNRPEKVLQDISGRLPHNELFEAHIVRCNGTADAVRAGLLRALGRKPEWSLLRDDQPDPDTVVLMADTKGFGWKQRVVVVAGQTADNEVAVWFKLFAFTLGDKLKLNLSGLTEDSYKPLHPRYASAERASAVQDHLSSQVYDFNKRIREELR